MKSLKYLIAASLLSATTIAPAIADTLKAEGGSAAGLSALVPQLLSKYANDKYEIRVNVDQTLTRAALKTATGAIDVASIPAGAYAKMKTGKGPYKKLGDEAVDASKNIRALFSFLGGHIHPMTYADSDIKSFEDVRGKRVFIGPPAGSAAAQSAGIIEAVTGMKAGEDYEGIKLAWGAANQAFEDGKFDLFMRTGTMGSAAIDQFGSAKKYRLVGIPQSTLSTDAWANYIKVPGRAADTLPAGTYENMANNGEDVLLSAYVMFVGVHKDMADDVAYDLTKAMFENLDDAHAVSKGLTPLKLDSAFVSLNAKLHPGAIKYFEEKGVAIPESVR